MAAPRITTLFLDIGGVLLTNGWDGLVRRRAAENFGLDPEDMNERHHLTFDAFEAGKLSLDTYLDRVVFFRKRPFSRSAFKKYMFGQSRPYTGMIRLFTGLKKDHGLKIAAVSNEGRELMDYRIKKFHLDEFIDFFVASCYVHFRKPDEDIYRIALDIAQTPAGNAVYVDDRAMFVEVAGKLGLRGIHHTCYESTLAQLKSLSLVRRI